MSLVLFGAVARGYEQDAPQAQNQQTQNQQTQPTSQQQPAPTSPQQPAPPAQQQPEPVQEAPPTQPVRVFNEQDTPAAQPSTPQSKTALQPVQVIKGNTVKPAVLEARKSSYTFKVGADDWTDTKVTVTTGDRLEFSADGTLTLNDGRTSTPDGLARGWRDLVRGFPLNSAPNAALIGRVGNAEAAVPFALGSQKSVDVSSTGTLYLRANLSSDLSATGDYSVTMKLAKAADVAKAGGAAAGSAASTAPTAAANLGKALSPQLFQNIPRQVQDQAGDPGDMVNFALIGSEDQVKKAFTAAGWVQVDKTTGDAVVHGLIATLAHEAYTQMPMSTLYLFNRSQDLSFARADPVQVAAVRHHLRVWKSGETVDGRPLWVGSATHDNGFEKDQRNGGVTHHIDPNVDEERDFLEHSFAASGVVEGAAYVLPANPLTTAHTATGGDFHSDGRIVVMELH